MNKSRLEAFSDGVLAIVITIMVLELKVPQDDNIYSLMKLLPVFLSYILSFIYIGIYWNNHHHMMRIVDSVNGRILWANLNLLFWLSLVPFSSGWMGENDFTKWPTALYGFVLLMCAISYSILSNALIHHHGKNSALAKAIGNDRKGKISVGIYLAAIVASLFFTWLAMTLYLVVAIMWFIPDMRIEKKIREGKIKVKD